MISKSNRPYLVRAIWEWCADNGYTPYLSVRVDGETRVPVEHVRNGEIVLNLSADATHRLTIGNEVIQFAARFAGVSRECSIPMAAVRGIFARENGEGLFFEAEVAAPSTASAGATEESSAADSPSSAPTPGPCAPGPGQVGRKSHLQIVK